MKQRILSCLGWTMLALAATGCVPEDINLKEEGDAEIRRSMTVKVIDDGNQDKEASHYSRILLIPNRYNCAADEK